jgi:predicted nucleic acid-binding protein
VTLTRAVFDASALVRATAAPEDAAAEEWVAALAAGQVEGLAPDLVYAEVANALCLYVRDAALSAEDADAKLRLLIELPLRIASLKSVAADALALAVERPLSVYDASYLVLAEAADAVLVTADRRLAQAAKRAALLPNARPPTSSP